LSDDPVDEPDGTKDEVDTPEEASEGRFEAALEPAPETANPSEHLERRARLAEDRLTEVLAAYRQVRTENEGFRERVTRDVERAFDRRHERLLLKFIDILDNLDRALEAAEQTYTGTPLIEGLILVRTQLLQTLQKEGLERIPVLGLPFDPTYSEAVGTQTVAEPEHDQVVVKELLRGYRLNGRVARVSRVLVGHYREGAVPGSEEPADELIGVDEGSAGLDPGGVLDTTEEVASEEARELLGDDEDEGEE
jgi:molecular chaperone GrpE